MISVINRILSSERRADGIFYSRSSSSLEACSISVFLWQSTVPSPSLLTSAWVRNCPRVQLCWYSKGQDIICNVGHICHMKSAEQWYFAPLKFASNYFVVFHTHSKCVCPKFHLLHALLWFCLRFQKDKRIGLLLDLSWLGKMFWTKKKKLLAASM